MPSQTLMLDKNEQGFTLIEVLVSVAILVIGVAAIFALISVSDRTLQNSVDRAQLNAQANAIIETLHSDQMNIAEYDNKNIGKCGSLTGKSDQRDRLKKWCEQMKGESGKTTSQDKRMVRVTKKKIGPREVNIVTVELTNRDGKNTVFTKRVFYAP